MDSLPGPREFACLAASRRFARMPPPASPNGAGAAVMCSRFVRHTKPSVYATLFGVDSVPGGPSYNIAPTQPVAAVRVQDGHRQCALLRWGLVPSWSKDGKPFINARGETVATKPTFRAPFRRHR